MKNHLKCLGTALFLMLASCGKDKPEKPDKKMENSWMQVEAESPERAEFISRQVNVLTQQGKIVRVTGNCLEIPAEHSLEILEMFQDEIVSFNAENCQEIF